MRIRSQTRTVRVYDKPRACRAHRDSRAGPNLLALREGEEGTVSHENGPLVAVTLRDSDRYGWVEKASLDIGDVDVEGPLRVVRTTTRPLTRFTWTRRKHLIGVRHVCQPQKLKFDNNGIPYVSVVENPPMRIYLHQNFPDLDLDTVVVLIVTIFTDTSPMRYAPLPLVGGFADWDDLMRLGVKVHWKGSDGTYLMGQVQMETGDEVDPLEMYYSVSNLNAALRGLVYENPSPLRPGYGVAHVNDFTMDWLGQKSTVCDQPIQHVQEPGIVTLVPRLKSLGFKVVNPANSTAARLKSLGSKVLNPTKSVVQTSVCDTCEASAQLPSMTCTSSPRIGACGRCSKYQRVCTWNGKKNLKAKHLTKYLISPPESCRWRPGNPPASLLAWEEALLAWDDANRPRLNETTQQT